MVLLNFLLPIPLGGKRRGNRDTLGKKTSSKAAFLIFPLHNSFEDIFLLLSLQPLIVSSSFRFFVAKLGVDVFDKNNAKKYKRDNPGSTDADANGETRADNPGTRTNANAGADNPSIAEDNLDTTADNPGIAIDDLGIIADNLGIAVDNPGKETDVDAGADNLNTAASNKARAAPLFVLCRAFFLLALSYEVVTVSLPSSLSSSSSTTLRLKPILSC